jgi:hypothetical protein
MDGGAIALRFVQSRVVLNDPASRSCIQSTGVKDSFIFKRWIRVIRFKLALVSLPLTFSDLMARTHYAPTPASHQAKLTERIDVDFTHSITFHCHHDERQTSITGLAYLIELLEKPLLSHPFHFGVIATWNLKDNDLIDDRITNRSRRVSLNER